MEKNDRAAAGTGSTIQKEFARRLWEEWLPAFCDDPKRNYAHNGFRAETTMLTDADADNFMKALDHGVAFPDCRQRFGMRLGRASEAMFWEGKRTITPRPFSLWAETVITVATGARLHFAYGWPVELLCMQSKGSAFDLGAFQPFDLDDEHIAVEVKRTSADLDRLVDNLQRCCAGDHDPTCLKTGGKRRNAHMKWIALRNRCPHVFWAVGPSPASRIFEVSRLADGTIYLQESDKTKLRFVGTSA